MSGVFVLVAVLVKTGVLVRVLVGVPVFVRVLVAVLVAKGVLVKVGVTPQIGPGPTLIVPTINGWIVQWYGYVPGVRKIYR